MKGATAQNRAGETIGSGKAIYKTSVGMKPKVPSQLERLSSKQQMATNADKDVRVYKANKNVNKYRH